jgi:hypothetical protein
MYLMDCNLGELIGINDPTLTPNSNLNLVGIEWRYSGGYALSLFLDGHVDGVPEFENLRELEIDYKVRVLNLDKNRFFPPAP